MKNFFSNLIAYLLLFLICFTLSCKIQNENNVKNTIEKNELLVDDTMFEITKEELNWITKKEYLGKEEIRPYNFTLKTYLVGKQEIYQRNNYNDLIEQYINVAESIETGEIIVTLTKNNSNLKDRVLFKVLKNDIDIFRKTMLKGGSFSGFSENPKDSFIVTLSKSLYNGYIYLKLSYSSELYAIKLNDIKDHIIFKIIT